MPSITPYKRSSSRPVSRSKRSKVGYRSNQKKRVATNYAPVTISRYPFPLRMQNVLKYVEEVQLSIDGSGYGQYIFSTNGMFDPNTTGTGHQPMYFDQMYAIYNHYHVIKSKMNATITRMSVAGDVNAVIVIDDDATTGATKYRTLAERTGAVTWTAFPAAGVSPTKTKYWNAAYTFGGNTIDNPQLQGTSATNPAEQSHFVIGVEAADAATGTVNVLVEIYYTAVWSELWSQSPS